MNLNYVSSYLGYSEVASPSHVPLGVLGQVDNNGGGRGQGRGQRRVKEKRSGEVMGGGGPAGFRQVGVNVPHATSMT